MRGVARAEGAHHYGAQRGGVEHVAYQLRLQTGEKRQHHDVGIEQQVRHHRARIVGLKDVVGVEVEGYSCLAEVGIVERVERIEAIGIALGGAIAAQQPATEVDANLGNHRPPIVVVGCGQLDTGDKVLLAVGSQLANRQLRTREHNRLG